MRLPNDVRTRFLALALTGLLAGCGAFSGSDQPQIASSQAQAVDARTGPAADYPVVVGEPYSIGGKRFIPLDTMNFDEVGYAVADRQGGAGVTVAHRTLPMPSYVEITDLETGRTILARVERRGPMAGNGAVALSRGAQAQLQVAEGAPIRVRRVNPVEADRAKLRMGQMAPLRMETPKSLLTVLKRKLSRDGAVSLAAAKPQARAAADLPTGPSTNELPPLRQAASKPAPQRVAVPASNASRSSFESAFSQERKVVTSYPLAPLDRTDPVSRVSRNAVTAPVVVDRAANRGQPRVVRQPRTITTAVQPSNASTSFTPSGNFVVQAAAFSSRSNAEKAANSIDGFIQRSGQFYRVRMGPYANRGQAEAALAKVRAAGYRDARVFTAG